MYGPKSRQLFSTVQIPKSDSFQEAEAIPLF